MSSSPEQPPESTEPTRLGDSFKAVREEIKHNAEFYRDVAQTISAHQIAMAAQHDPHADPSVLAAAEEQLRLTQATLDHLELENSQQPPEDND